MSFDNNAADIGGAYSYEGIEPVVTNIQLSSNIARMGP